MITALAKPARTGNPGIVPPWLQGGDRPVAPPAAEPTRDALVAVPTSDGVIIFDIPTGHAGHDHGARPGRGATGLSDARRGSHFAAEQRRVDGLVGRIQDRYAELGITEREGNGPVNAKFLPDFPNAAYAPEGMREYGVPSDSIAVGVDPRSGRPFAEAEDVVAHELAHRIIDHMTPGSKPLSMHPMSEDVAVHESLADTFAALVDTDDWTLGEDLVQPVRIMDRPERLGHPGHVEDLARVFGPGSKHMVPVGHDRRTGKLVKAPDWHVWAGVPNKAASIIGSELGRDTMGKIYLKAVRENVRPGRKVEGLAAAVLMSARDLFGADSREFQVTRDAWDAVGVLDLLRAQADEQR